MTDFLWYLEQNHDMALEAMAKAALKDMTKEEIADFMTELRTPAPKGPIDL